LPPAARAYDDVRVQEVEARALARIDDLLGRVFFI
jgi:hypothetical protein